MLKVLPLARRPGFYGFSLSCMKTLVANGPVAREIGIKGKFYQQLADENFIGVRFLQEQEEDCAKIGSRGAGSIEVSIATALNHHEIKKVRSTLYIPFEQTSEGIFLINVRKLKIAFADKLELFPPKIQLVDLAKYSEAEDKIRTRYVPPTNSYKTSEEKPF